MGRSPLMKKNLPSRSIDTFLEGPGSGRGMVTNYLFATVKDRTVLYANTISRLSRFPICGIKNREDAPMMSSIPFDPASGDLPPIPFDEESCALAQQLKEIGLPWQPHVGCFVWDSENLIRPDSPFPNRIYFILSLPRFVDLLGSREAIQEKLIWLPTWHQARLLCQQYSLDAGLVKMGTRPAEELQSLYRLLLDRLATQQTCR